MALPSCYTDGASLSPIGPPLNIYIHLLISLRIPARTIIVVLNSSASVCFTTCTTYGYKERSGNRIQVWASVQTGPGAHPTSYTMGTGSLPGVKWPGRGVDHPPPPPSSAEVKERLEPYLYSPSQTSWSIVGLPLTLPGYTTCSTDFFFHFWGGGNVVSMGRSL